MKKLLLGLTVAAFAFVPALQAGEGKDCKDAKACTDSKVKATECAAKTACCAAEKQAKLKKGFNPSANKGAMQLVRR